MKIFMLQCQVDEITQFSVAVFNYASGQHNVVPVNGAGYQSCKATADDASQAATTGNDKFKLKRGANYFICSLPGHCEAGMKILVNAN